MWSVAALWFVPLVYLYKAVPRLARVAIRCICVAAVGWQLDLAHWLYTQGPGPLYMAWTDNLYRRNSLFGPQWRHLLPSFYDFQHYATSSRNLLGGAVVLTLVAAGFIWTVLARKKGGPPRGAP